MGYVVASGGTLRSKPCATFSANSSLSGRFSGSDTGHDTRIFVGIAPSLRWKWQGGPVIILHTPQKTRGCSAII